jgi:hypothetical protein
VCDTSIPDGRADRNSDIDLRVELRGVSDRALAERTPDLLRSIGPYVIEAWGPTALPERFIRMLYFADLLLFWHVDVWCNSDIHADGADLKSAFHWPQMFRVWVDELNKVLRGPPNTIVMDRFAREWMDPASLPTDLNERLSAYLGRIHQHAALKGAPCDELFSRCDALLREYLGTGAVAV